MHVETLRWEGELPGRVSLLDQTRLPAEEVRLSIAEPADMVVAIQRLSVRGAPAIGIAGAYGVVLEAQKHTLATADELMQRVRAAAALLAAARPTAVNLAWAVRRVLARAERDHAGGADAPSLARGLLDEALAIHREDAASCRRMGEHGSRLLRDGMTVLTHCNAGALATGGMGTALAPIYVASESGARLRVLADETRPLLQGARITAWELDRAGIDVTVLVDGAAAGILARGEVDAVVVGSDRIARNGDVCNKVGTYGLAVLAARHGVPFYVVAPVSTFDPDLETGPEIPIEERAADEVLALLGVRAAPLTVKARNPAFDVTPAELVTAIITEHGTIERPDRERVDELLRRARDAS